MKHKLKFAHPNSDGVRIRPKRRRMDPNQLDSNGRPIPKLARIGLPSCPSFPYCNRIPNPPPINLPPSKKPLPFMDVPPAMGPIKIGAGDEPRKEIPQALPGAKIPQGDNEVGENLPGKDQADQ